MKKRKNRFPLLTVICSLLIAHCSLLLVSCDEPGPLFGSWSDNKGNTLKLNADNTFNAKITYIDGLPPLNESGKFTVLRNSLTFDCKEIDQKIVTEWDIRGNILYLNWTTPDGDTKPLTLFKVQNG